MKVTIFTMDEPVYVPLAVGILSDAPSIDISCIVLASPFKRRVGKFLGFWQYATIVGPRGMVVLGVRSLMARFSPLLGLRPVHRRYWSVREIGALRGIPTFASDNVNSWKTLQILEDYPSELLLSVACPQKILGTVRSRFPLGAINVHSGKLPRYRGAFPSFWTLLHGETSTAVTVHDLVDEIDGGDILLQKVLPIAPDDTWDSLVRKTKIAGGEALVEAIMRIEAGTIVRTPNRDDQSSCFGFPTRQDVRALRSLGRRMF